MSAYDDQEAMFEAVLEDAALICTNGEQLKHLESFLDNIYVRVKSCRAQFVNSKVGVRWTWDAGYVSVLFGDDQTWEWEGKSTKPFANSKEYKYFTTFSFSGGPSHVRKDIGPIYWLPTEISKLLEVPDTFVGTYEPMLERRECTTVWTTSAYDGPLAGYCEYKGKLHLFEHVEETEFARHRMFVVFELSLLERMSVWWRYHIWHTIRYNRILWNMHTYKWNLGWKLKRLFKVPTETYEQRLIKLKKTHKIVGYFKG